MKATLQSIAAIAILLMACHLPVSAQSPPDKGGKQVEVLKTDSLIGMQGGQVQKLIGNVILKHEETLLYCDSAIRYLNENRIKAFGHVNIRQGDSVRISGDTLVYEGNKKEAWMRGKVFLTDRNMQLSTKDLEYHMDTKYARYRRGGLVISGNTKLTSETGYYYSKSKNAFFKDNVVLVNPNYTLNADTLEYNVDSEIANFHGPTTIISEANTVYCEKGWYDTKKDIALFRQNAFLSAPPQTVKADSIYYERKAGYGRIYDNAILIDTAQHIQINCNFAEYFEHSGTIIATEDAIMANDINGDTLFLSGDTLKSLYDTLTDIRELFAYRDVRIFKSDMQGLCDSFYYSDVDSIMRMFRNPVLWSDSSQFSGDTIHVLMHNKKIHQAHFYRNAFIATKNDSLIYNQIKGDTIYGYFKNDTLNRLLVDGNAQSIYYLQDDNKAYLGPNEAKSEIMWIYLDSNKVSRISFVQTPSGTMHPMRQIKPEELMLDGFLWREAEKPTRKEDLLINRGDAALHAVTQE